MQFFNELLASVLFLFLNLWGGVVVTPSTTVLGTTTATVSAVIDGDTIIVSDSAGNTTTVRYIGIDTPEPYRDGIPACGSHEATKYNSDLTLHQTVTLVPDTELHDTYGRALHYVYVDDLFVNEALVTAGYADTMPIPPNTRFRAELANAKSDAQSSGRGLWSLCPNGVQ